MDTEYNKAIDYLKGSPMFNLSLSSKELFHSNFLYWIWKLNPTAFKCLIAKFLNISTDELNWENNWEVEREYHSFDLCVKYPDSIKEEDGKMKIVSGDVLLVLENKVKSIPYKAQLKKYVDKVEKLYGKRHHEDANKVQYILLTLPTHFPDAPEGIDSEDCNWEVENGYKWKIVTYNKYIEKIKSLKDAFTEISDSFNLKEEDKCYVTKIIDDYIEFVNHLLVIYNEWTDKCYDKLGFIYYDKLKQQCSEYIGYITTAQDLRIHDLFHKSKYARICTDIITKFNEVSKECVNIELEGYEVGINVADRDISNFLKTNKDKKGYIVWEYNYIHGEPLVGVKIARKDKEDNLITYIIQVQSGIYEHGIIADCSAEEIWDNIRQKSSNSIYSVGGYSWMRYKEFDANATKDSLPLFNPENVLSSDKIFGTSHLYPEYKKRQDTLPYAKYAGNNSNFAMIYQFRKLQRDVTTSDVIDYLVNDVKQLLEQLNKPQ